MASTVGQFDNIFLKRMEYYDQTLTTKHNAVDACEKEPIILTPTEFVDFWSLHVSVGEIIFNHAGLEFNNVTFVKKNQNVPKITVPMEDILQVRLTLYSTNQFLSSIVILVSLSMAEKIRSDLNPGDDNADETKNRFISLEYKSIRQNSVIKYIFLQSHFTQMSSAERVTMDHEIWNNRKTSKKLPHFCRQLIAVPDATDSVISIAVDGNMFFGNVETQLREILLTTEAFRFRMCRPVEGKHLDNPRVKFNITIPFSDIDLIDVALGPGLVSSYMFILLQTAAADKISDNLQFAKLKGVRRSQNVSFVFKNQNTAIIDRLRGSTMKCSFNKPLNQAALFYKTIQDSRFRPNRSTGRLSDSLQKQTLSPAEKQPKAKSVMSYSEYRIRKLQANGALEPSGIPRD